MFKHVAIHRVIIEIGDYTVQVSRGSTDEVRILILDGSDNPITAKIFTKEQVHRVGDAGRWVSEVSGVTDGKNRGLVLDHLRVAAKCVWQIT